MKIEYNTAILTITDPSPGVMLTPAISPDFWLLRCAVSEKQAIICFPKFCVIGIGFQHEEDWNTNFPSTVEAQKIFDHIKHNKGDESISDEICVKAIKEIQAAILELTKEGNL